MRRPRALRTVASSGEVGRILLPNEFAPARHEGRARLLLHPSSLARPFALIPSSVAWEHLAYRDGVILNFAMTGLREVVPSQMGRISTAPCRQNLATSSTIQRRPQEK
jgi:hypothetical protein